MKERWSSLKTEIWKVNKSNPDLETMRRASQIIKQGGLVAFPTETVYGLGANGLDAQAVLGIFKAKGRPADNPLILHIANQKDVFYLAAGVPLKAQVLIEAFWPGPLTLVLPKSRFIPQEVTCGLDTVAIRMPRHPVALALIREAGVPLAAPSANTSGYPSTTEASHVISDMDGKIDLVLDGGPAGFGLESTVIDMSGEKPLILRPGGITREQIEEVIGPVEYDPANEDSHLKPRSPGMKYKHYSPHAQVVLLEGEPEEIADMLVDLIAENKEQGKKVGLLLTAETLNKLPDKQKIYWRNLGSRHDLEHIARNLYAELRSCDNAGIEVIYTETYARKDIGAALMNRLVKSSEQEIRRKQ